MPMANLFYSTNGGPFVHAVQGGYFYKSFGKHGPLHNLHAYHYFPELERDQVPGGPPTGGTIYLADTFPHLFRGSFIAGNFLGHTVSWWTVEPTGSTVQAHVWRRVGRFARHLVRPDRCLRRSRRRHVLQRLL